MIFIPIDYVLNDFAGNPGKVVLSQIFPSLSRKTAQNWLTGRNKLSRGSKGDMADDLEHSEIREDARGPLLENAWGLADNMSDQAVKTPWYTILKACEHGLQKGHDKDTLIHYPLLQLESMKQLKLLEEDCHELEGILCDKNFDRALTLLSGEMEHFPLFNRLIEGVDWLDGIRSIEDLMRFIPGMQLNSFLYLVAILDISLVHRTAAPDAEPIFEKYIPFQENGEWVLPLKVWFDELRTMAGQDSSSSLARAFSGEFGNWVDVRQNIYRWRRGKPIPPWEEIAAKLKKLEGQGFYQGMMLFCFYYGLESPEQSIRFISTMLKKNIFMMNTWRICMPGMATGSGITAL